MYKKNLLELAAEGRQFHYALGPLFPEIFKYVIVEFYYALYPKLWQLNTLASILGTTIANIFHTNEY